MNLSPAVGCLAVCPRLFGLPQKGCFLAGALSLLSRLFSCPGNHLPRESGASSSPKEPLPARVSFNYFWPSAIVFALALLTPMLGSAGGFIL